MADGERIAKAYVEIEADLSKVPAGMNQLSSTVTSKILELKQKTQAQLARNQLQMKVALNAGNMKDFDRLVDAQKRLEAMMVKVNTAALNQASALRKVNAEAARTPRTPKPGGDGSGGGGGMNGAMGLLVLSQTIDDMQYGFRAIVNNIPQMGMALGSAMGMGVESSMKLAGTLGIAAVAVNLLITHWDDLMNLMGMGKVLTEAEQMEKLAKATKLTADEQERLNRFKREESFREDMRNKATSGSEKTEAEYKKVVADLGNDQASGRNRLVAGLVGTRRAEGRGAKMTDAEEKRLNAARSNARVFGGKFWEDRAEKLGSQIQARLDAEDVKNAGKIVDTAGFDPANRKILANAVRANPDAFPANAARIGQINQAKNTTDEEARQRDLEAKLTNRELDARDRAARKAEDSRLAASMMGSVGQKFLANPTMTNESLEAEVKKTMGKAGLSSSTIDAAAEGVAKAIRKKMDEAIHERAMDRGIKDNVAAQQLLKEANDLDDRQANRPKAEIMSTESYLSKLLVGSLNQKGDTPKEQLAEQKTTNKKLDGVIKALNMKDAVRTKSGAVFAKG